MTEPSRQLAEKGRQRQISGSLETFSDLSSGLVLVKGSLIYSLVIPACIQAQLK